MLNVSHRVSVKGQILHVPALQFDDIVVIVSGSVLRIAKVFDAYWLKADQMPSLPEVVERLKAIDRRPDLLTFTQRVPATTPTFDFPFEWDNVAVIPVSSYDHWFHKQVSSASRRNIRTSEKKGVSVRERPFDEQFIRGIMAISNESPIRAGRQYWHYGKDCAAVEAEQGTYRERSTFLGAYVADDMIGYMKIVWDERTAAIMQIVSSLKSLDHRPNNALLAAAVKLCAERGVEYLQYERFVYGKKIDSSLTRFKRENGFVRMDLPCYFVPLTARGKIALRLGLHRSIKDRLPGWLVMQLLSLRDWGYSRQELARGRREVVNS